MQLSSVTPGLSADRAIANKALEDCTEIRKVVRQHLGLES
jgi:hypothetical protein